MVPMATATADGSVRLGRETTSSSIKVTMFTQHNAGSGTGCRMKALAREWAELGTVLEQAARGEARLQASLWASQTAWRNNFLSPSSATPGCWAQRRMTHTSGGRSGDRERPPKPAEAAAGLDSSTLEGATKLAEQAASSCALTSALLWGCCSCTKAEQQEPQRVAKGAANMVGTCW